MGFLRNENCLQIKQEVAVLQKETLKLRVHIAPEMIFLTKIALAFRNALTKYFKNQTSCFPVIKGFNSK